MHLWPHISLQALLYLHLISLGLLYVCFIHLQLSSNFPVVFHQLFRSVLFNFHKSIFPKFSSSLFLKDLMPFKIFIYLFIFGRTGSLLLGSLSLVAASRGSPSSWCADFSEVASLAAEPRL